VSGSTNVPYSDVRTPFAYRAITFYGSPFQAILLGKFIDLHHHESSDSFARTYNTLVATALAFNTTKDLAVLRSLAATGRICELRSTRDSSLATNKHLLVSTDVTNE
jgi:hypothetical protein